MILQIPVDNLDYDQQFSVELDGVVYRMRICWNDRFGRYVLDLSDEFGTLLVGGIPLLAGESLLTPYTDQAVPPGDLYLFDASGNDNEATQENFGESVFLMYQSVSA